MARRDDRVTGRDAGNRVLQRRGATGEAVPVVA